MNIVDSLMAEVEHRANDKLDDILYRLLNRLDKRGCERHTNLVHYIIIKLRLHHANKKYRDASCPKTDWMHLWLQVNNLKQLAQEKRKTYYESSCGCGSCKCG